MKLKILILTSILFSTILFASHLTYVSTYIPISDENKKGIELHKVLFYTYYSHPESAIDSVVWSYKANTPHERYKDLESNIAHIKGLKVNLNYRNDNSCDITIDSRNVIRNDETGDLNTILKYVKKATVLNMKNANLHCKIISKTAPKEVTKFFPKPLNIARRDVEVFKDYTFNSFHAPFVHDTIYPLGYSSNGKLFAYIIEHDNDPADFVSIETVIQNLVSDKIVWRNSFRDENYKNPVNFKTFWKKKHWLIEKKLKSYNIQPMKNMQLKEILSYKIDGYFVGAKERRTYVKDWNMAFLNSATIYIDSKSKGRKTIDKQNYKTKSHLLSRRPLGFIISGKKRKRVAVLVGTVRRGWEGPPHNLNYEIIGANLEVGFNK